MNIEKITAYVPIKDLAAYIAKHSPRHRIFAWLVAPARDDKGCMSGVDICNHMRITLPAACAWADQMARAHGHREDCCIEVTRHHGCMFIG